LVSQDQKKNIDVFVSPSKPNHIGSKLDQLSNSISQMTEAMLESQKNTMGIIGKLIESNEMAQQRNSEKQKVMDERMQQLIQENRESRLFLQNLVGKKRKKNNSTSEESIKKKRRK